jgi:RNA polymerase sigma-70 factor (ECF subfamily)
MATDQPQPDTDRVVGTLLANHRRFLDFLSAKVGSREDAEEILQDAFVRGVQRAAEIRDGESAVAWFYRLLRNAIVDYYRHRAAGRRALESYARGATEGDFVADADLERAVCACINDLIPNLKPEYADLIRRVDLGEESIGSLADGLGLTAANARVRLHRARAALRKELERSCRTCATHGCLDCSCSPSSGTRPQQ